MSAKLQSDSVKDLQAAGVLLVEDGNHGENRPRPDEFSQQGVAFIRAADLDGGRIRFDSASRINDRAVKRVRKGIGQPGDIILSHKGTVGKLATAPLDCEPFVCSPQTTFWRVLQEDQLDRRFLYFFMNSLEFKNQLAAVKGETDMADYVSLTAQRRLQIPRLPLVVQKEIGRVLGSLDEKIELNRRMNETLEAMAQAIFRDWFVDFGPTRRKLEGATDPLAIMGGLVQDTERAQALADLFPAALGDDGLPEGWKTVELAESFDSVMGQSPPGTSYNESGTGLPFFQGRRDFGFRFPQNRVYCTSPSRIAEENWTLISVRAPVGDVNRAKERCCIGRGVGAIIHKQKLQSLTYYTILELKPLLARFDGDGTVFGSINQKQVKSLPVVRAPLEIMREFETLVSPMDELIRTKSEEIETLSTTRDLLLPKLMSGEIRLSAANEAAA